MIKIYHDDCLNKLKDMESNSIDSIITDPPAGISFMGKNWDSDKGGKNQWIKWLAEIMKECHRVLKPGGHGLVWAIPRTSHWTGMALENAGFEIRDVVTHLFGQGFPKSLNVSKAIDKMKGEIRRTDYVPNHKNNNYGKGLGGGEWNANQEKPKTNEAKQWDGYGTALKPAVEFWYLVRKPLSEKNVALNVLKWGTGAINIDASRIGNDKHTYSINGAIKGGNFGNGKNQSANEREHKTVQGRFPSNLILDEDSAKMLDEQSIENGIHLAGKERPKKNKYSNNGMFTIGYSSGSSPRFNDIGRSCGASRFFYCAKVSTSERNRGLVDIKNFHPTVKPIKLMKYLITMITPPNGTVLDCFMGSGSTGIAAKELGFNFIGIEKEKEYFEIAKARINSIE